MGKEEGHLSKKPTNAQNVRQGKKRTGKLEQAGITLPSLPSLSDTKSKGTRVGGAGPSKTVGATEAAHGKGEGKPPGKQTTPQEGEEEPTSVKNSDGKNASEKEYTYLSNLTNLKKRTTYLANRSNLKEKNAINLTYTYLADNCPTSDATEAELEFWEAEMVLLHPFYLKKRTGEPPQRRDLLVKADMEKAAKKVVPRFRAESRAAELQEEAVEILEPLEEKVLNLKTAPDEEEEDDLKALFTEAEPCRAQAKALALDLAAQRYRGLPDRICAGIQGISTRFNKVAQALKRLKKPR